MRGPGAVDKASRRVEICELSHSTCRKFGILALESRLNVKTFLQGSWHFAAFGDEAMLQTCRSLKSKNACIGEFGQISCQSSSDSNYHHHEDCCYHYSYFCC